MVVNRARDFQASKDDTQGSPRGRRPAAVRDRHPKEHGGVHAGCLEGHGHVPDLVRIGGKRPSKEGEKRREEKKWREMERYLGLEGKAWRGGRSNLGVLGIRWGAGEWLFAACLELWGRFLGGWLLWFVVGVPQQS